MRNIRKQLTGVALLINLYTMAQDNKPAPFAVSGYAEVYYGFDFNKPADNNRPGFFYSHNRHNEFNLNLGFIKGSYNTDNVRVNLAIGAGTYMNANYAAEPGVLKNVYEANAGIRLSKKKNLWLDAGILPSHIGFESAVSKDCRTLTRSILAENSPYYEAGAKVTYTSNNNKWLFSVLALNGWQRIKRIDGNSLMSFGTQVQYKPDASTTFNYSTFIGTDKPDSTRQMRYFHNVYAVFNVSSKVGITAGIDMGMEQKVKGGSGMNSWYAPVLIIKYSINSQWAIAARGEYYADEKGVIIATGTPHGYETSGFSLNADYAPAANVLLRLEGRTLNSRDAIFNKKNEAVNNNAFVTASIAVAF